VAAMVFWAVDYISSYYLSIYLSAATAFDQNDDEEEEVQLPCSCRCSVVAVRRAVVVAVG